MKATEVVSKLYKIRNNLTNDEQKEAINIAIIAIEYCSRMYIMD